MNIPTLSGIIRRRILLNYRIAPEVVQAVLPSRFRPNLFGGYAIGGVCLIRLEQMRPAGLPVLIGVASENSAHRIAVEWEDQDGCQRKGVFVPRRDTDSRMNAFAGGRLFPGVHHLSRFSVRDGGGQIALQVLTDDGDEPLVDVQASETETLPDSSVFGSLQASSAFFEGGCVGYSSRTDSCILDGLRLEVPEWRVTPLAVSRIHSAYFGNRSIFPATSIAFDHALLMRDVAHRWHSQPTMSTIDRAG